MYFYPIVYLMFFMRRAWAC